MFFLPTLLYFGRSGASALPCAGAAPPQRPPTKPSLTDRVHSSQPVGWRAWRRLYTSYVTKGLNGSKDDWLVKYCGLVVTNAVRILQCEGSLNKRRELLHCDTAQGQSEASTAPSLVLIYFHSRGCTGFPAWACKWLQESCPFPVTCTLPPENVCASWGRRRETSDGRAGGR